MHKPLKKCSKNCRENDADNDRKKAEQRNSFLAILRSCCCSKKRKTKKEEEESNAKGIIEEEATNKGFAMKKKPSYHQQVNFASTCDHGIHKKIILNFF